VNTAIVTDSSACLPANLLTRHNIRTVPLGLLIDGDLIPDGSLSPRELFARVDKARTSPQSTSPAPSDFLTAFREAADAGATSVLCLTLSARYSGTYSAAQAAAGLAGEAMPGTEISVVDTGGLAMTHGFAILAATHALETGATTQGAAATAREVGAKARLVGVLDTMRYLVKGGRVPRVVGWAASILGIRPVLAFESGDARAIARTRTIARGEQRMLDYVDQHAQRKSLHAAVMHTGAERRAERLRDELCRRFSLTEILLTEFTSVMAVHTGPGFVGVAFYHED
jgi:fatty acid kinase fatty acid binding subunit